MKNLTKKDASEVKDVTQSELVEDEQLNELVANVQPQQPDGSNEDARGEIRCRRRRWRSVEPGDRGGGGDRLRMRPTRNHLPLRIGTAA